MPKKIFDANAENKTFELIANGDYPFEIVGVDFGISNGGKTSGSDTMELKVAFFKDKTFETRVAQWTEYLIFHKTCEWKIDVFTKCANMLVGGKAPDHQTEVDYSEATLLGLRGWATVRSHVPDSDKNKPAGEQRRFNHVEMWITNKEKLARAAVSAGSEEEEPLPF